MEILTFPIGPLSTNCYLLINGKEALAVDVGGNPSPVLSTMEQKGLSLKAILLTHLHPDHTYGVSALHETTGAEVFASGQDTWLQEESYKEDLLWGLPKVTPYSFTPIKEGTTSFIGLQCQIIATPGHTPGGLCFYFPEAQALFAGDTLFYRSIGRTDFPRGDTEALLRSIKQGLVAIPDEVAVYPGHGIPTIMGHERTHNQFLR